MRNRIFRTLCIAALIAISCSCAADIARSALPPAESAPKPTPEKTAPEPGAAAVPEVLRQETLPANPVDELKNLWDANLVDAARRRFHQADLQRALQHRDSERSVWRGRLFVSHFSGASMGLAGENISALLADRDDLWAGTWTGGVARLSIPLGSAEVFDRGMPSLAVRTVSRIRGVPGGVTVVRYGAVERYDYRSGEWSSEKGLPATERLQDLLFAGGRTYLATLGRGLWVREGGTSWRELRVPGPFINRLEAGSGGLVYVMTMDRGLFIHNPESGAWTRPESEWLRQANVTSVIEYKGMLCGGTYGEGAFAWNPATEALRVFDRDDLGDAFVLTVLEYGGRVYFGTFGAGLRTWMPETDEWDTISLTEGFISADIASLAAGSAGVWAGTLEGGIMRVLRGIYGD